MAIIGGLGFSLAMDFVMYNIGRLAIFLLSLGKARAEGLRELVANNTHGHDQRKSRIVIPATVTMFIGVAVFSLASFLYFTLRH